MDVRRPDLEFDDIEKLLGEIPIATSGIPHSEEVTPKSLSLNGGSAPISVNSYKGPLTEKLQSNGIADEPQLLTHKNGASPIKFVENGETNLPDDQSLTSVMADLSFHSGSGSTKFKSSHKAPIVTSSMTGSPSFHSLSCGFDDLDAAKVGHQGLHLLKFDANELKQCPAGYCQSQPIESFSTALPLEHGVQRFQFFSNVAPEYPLMSNQPQFFTDGRSMPGFIHPQQLNHNHISWRPIEEGQFYRMHQQYLFLRQLSNQRLKAQHPIQANGTNATKTKNQNVTQPYFDVPISNQLQQSNREQFWNNHAAARGLNQCQNGINILDKARKQSFPEKILTRSQGLNTLKAVKFGSAVGNEMLANGKVVSNGHFRHTLSAPTAGFFQLDHLSPWNSSSDITDLKNNNLRLQPQKYNSLDEVTGRVYLMAKDQHGCRFLQRKFVDGTPQDVENIFREVIDHIAELMTDPFGNYLVQKLLEVCNEDQRMQILCSITRKAGELVRISCDMHGTRAVQKVIETLKSPQQFLMVVSSLKSGIVTLIKNMNGNHVAQRCLQYLKPEYSEFLFEAAIANCVELANDRHGCCVLQKCLSHSEGDQRRRLISEITSCALILSQDPFGNYVVQYIFELCFPWAIADILDQLEGNYADLSMQKYSSNVVEKCLKYASEERRARIIGELISNAHLDQIMQDPYGNYVIQAALLHSKGALHAALVEAIRPHVPGLRTSPYGKKVLSSDCLK